MQAVQLHLPSSILKRMEQAIASITRMIEDKVSLGLATSGGKDSTLTTLLALEAIRRANVKGIKQAPHFITSSDTTIDSPPLMFHLLRGLDEIQLYCQEHGLDVQVQVVKPSLASQFVVSTFGRGTLVRSVQNSVKDGVTQRQCADDWKVRPQQRARVAMAASASSSGTSIVTVLGMRRSESTVRANRMDERGESDDDVITNVQSEATFSPIASWNTDDVWWALALLKDPSTSPFPSALSMRTINRLHDLYREGNDGTCGVILGESGNRKVCLARFGCWACLQTGDKDKSMESMIKEPKHAHLAGLNRFRNYMNETQWDYTKREFIGRSVSDAGHIRIRPDVYNFEHRLTLLQIALTLDILEVERAEDHAEMMRAGLIEDNEENRELCEVQFQIVSPQQLVAIDFYMGLDHRCWHAFPALNVWYEVYELGRRYKIPDIGEPIAKASVPQFGWYKVGDLNLEAPTDGLRSYPDEMWNRFLHPSRGGSYTVTSAGDQMCYFVEDDQLEVDAMEAVLMVTCTFPTMVTETRLMDGLESSRFWLNQGILRLPKGKAALYNGIAKRHQYFKNLGARLNLAPDELLDHLKSHAITDQEHEALLAALPGAQSDRVNDAQALLF